MEIRELEIKGLYLVSPKKHGDSRGFFSETWKREAFRSAGIDADFVQDNHSLSGQRGVLRGLHWQLAPAAQAKLVRVVRGRIFDVAVDIRRGSETFGRHLGVELSASNWQQLFVPVGFAHGFVTLEPDTEVLYKVTAPYSPAHERGMLWNDPALGIDWGIAADAVVLSDRDRKHPPLAGVTDLFG